MANNLEQAPDGLPGKTTNTITVRQHFYNNQPINQLSEETIIAEFNIPVGYVNATQMCQSCDKLFADYARLKNSKAYWEALSADMGIPISGLVISIKGGNDKQAQSTWVHPEIAIDLAQWVSVEFRIWANRELKRLIEEKTQHKPKSTLTSTIPSIKEISELFDTTLTTIDPDLAARIKLQAVAGCYPELKTAVETASQILQAPKDRLLTPEHLAVLLTYRTEDHWSALAVNSILTNQGFQKEFAYGSIPYYPTEKGKKYGKIVTEATRSGISVSRMMWFEEILDAIKP
jgi:KilA-N domain